MTKKLGMREAFEFGELCEKFTLHRHRCRPCGRKKELRFSKIRDCTSFTVISGASSRRTRPCGVTSTKASSVTMWSTTSTSVSGSVQVFRIFGMPSRVTCSVAMSAAPGTTNQIHVAAPHAIFRRAYLGDSIPLGVLRSEQAVRRACSRRRSSRSFFELGDFGRAGRYRSQLRRRCC
jgi:hypothetical protein